MLIIGIGFGGVRGKGSLMPAVEPRMIRRFQLILIKPSHYDDDGYVIQWVFAFMPSSSLAAMYSLAVDAGQRQVLGSDVAVDITPIDETNERVRIDDILIRLRRHCGFGMVGLVGVQSNQFPRALDIARPLRAAGVPVVIGGFHVSGWLAMLPQLAPDLQSALDMGVSLFAGEAEGRLDEVLADAATGKLKPIYNYINDLVALESAPTPILPRRNIERIVKIYSSFDAGRGCPYQCSFCTIINVQGRKSRSRSPDDIEEIIRRHWAQGTRRLFITDDNFARNTMWEPILDRLIDLREREKIECSFYFQVDTLCHKIPNFIEKAARAGVKFVFIGLESINPKSLHAAKKPQNRIAEYRNMLLAWKKAGVITVAGYIIGFPADTPESIRESIEIIKRELPIDFLGFTCLTPLPGSEDHKVMLQKGDWIDADHNKFDAEHVVAKHPIMSSEEWQAIYNAAWGIYYSREHILTILRRARAAGLSLPWVIQLLVSFSGIPAIEKMHPAQGGITRRRYRLDRRPGFRIEPAWLFYLKFAAESVAKHLRGAAQVSFLCLLALRVLCDPRGKKFMDQALMPGRFLS
jgi:hypothetical protein